MEPISTMTLWRFYKPTVNESETITEAQPFCLVRREAAGCNGFGLAVSIPSTIERS
jgi:hypothetical protein